MPQISQRIDINGDLGEERDAECRIGTSLEREGRVYRERNVCNRGRDRWVQKGREAKGRAYTG